jgi:hypothetical protein
MLVFRDVEEPPLEPTPHLGEKDNWRQRSATCHEFRGILAVSQAATKGKLPLPGPVEELDFTRLEKDKATPPSVSGKWTHTAGFI